MADSRSGAARSRVLRVCLGFGLVVALASCGGEGANESGPESGDEPTSSSAGGDASSPGEPGSPGEEGSPSDASATDGASPTDGETTTAGGSPEGPSEDPSGPDFVLYSLPECSLVPGGSLSGADSLTIFVALRNAGPGSWDALVPYALSSDTGLSAQGNSAISTGSSFTPMQVDLGADDYNQSHRFQVVADPANTIVERSESNNAIEIVVDLPSAPADAADVSCSLA